MKTMRILGLDPALGNLGWCVVDVSGDGLDVEVCGCGVVSTSAKLTTMVRGARIRSELRKLLQGWVPQHVAYEAPSMPPNAGSAWKIGVAFGVIVGVVGREITTSMHTPQAIKGVVLSRSQLARAKRERKKTVRSRKTKNRAEGKAQMIRAIRRRFPEFPWPRRTGEHEHVADACGACLTFIALARRSVAR